MNNIISALRRSMLATASFVLIYVVGVVAGSVMVHSGNQFALNYRDRLVAHAHAQDPASLADQ